MQVLNDRRLQVFISSTYIDLVKERQAAHKAVLELQHIPAGMELFAAGTESAWSLIESVISRSDVYLLIVGGRYGSVDEKGISFTEKEYALALALGKPILAFLHRDPSSLPRSQTEDRDTGWQRLEQFRCVVQKEHTCAYWESAAELKACITVALVHAAPKIPGGWVRLESAPARHEPISHPKLSLLHLQDAVIKNVEEIDRLYGSNLALSGLPTGFIDLDRMTNGFRPGEVVVLAGRPGMGCTSLALDIVGSVGETTLPVLVISLRHKSEAISRKLLAQLGYISEHTLVSGKLNDSDWPRLTHTIAKLQEMSILIDDPVTADVKYIQDACAAAKHQFGALALIVVDDANLVSTSEGSNESKGRFFKRIAREFDSAVLLTSTVDPVVDLRVNKRPFTSDLDADLLSGTDALFFLYDDAHYNPDSPSAGTVELIISRNPYGPIGAIRLARLGRKFGLFSGFADAKV